MACLIDDLLHLSRVSRIDLRREQVDVTKLVRTAIDGLRGHDDQRCVTWEVEDRLTADADPRLLTIIFENLLGNAWKFTSKRAQAHVCVGQRVVTGESVFFVRDNGAGFDAQYAHNLFKPFQRLHNPSEFDGTGIGLATVQRAVTRHGGRVWAETIADSGATFFFTLQGRT
jgi:light-regulated signal transduction histidine kinase (bacteriophytochrome)